MAFNVKLADRIREYLAEFPVIEEKEMMGGLAFMVNEKMCVGVIQDEMMCRIAPEAHETAIERPGCRTMDFTKKMMRGWVMVDVIGMRTPQEFHYWIELALSFNTKAKSSKKKK
jgi:TfoX/Sxy family transcriptional regulator of competence genes